MSAYLRQPAYPSAHPSSKQSHGWPFRGKHGQTLSIHDTARLRPMTSSVYGTGAPIASQPSASTGHPSTGQPMHPSQFYHTQPSQTTHVGLPPAYLPPHDSSQFSSTGSQAPQAPWQPQAGPYYPQQASPPMMVHTAPSVGSSTHGAVDTDTGGKERRSILPWRRRRRSKSTAASTAVPLASTTEIVTSTTIPTTAIVPPPSNVVTQPSTCPSIGPSYLQIAATAFGALAASYLPSYWGTAGCTAVGLSSLGYSAARRIYDANSHAELSRLSIGQQVGNYFRRAHVGCSASLLAGAAAPLVLNAVTGSSIFAPESVLASSVASCAVGKLFQPSEASGT